jgi:hypothetical protein
VEHFSSSPKTVCFQLKLLNLRLDGVPSRLPPHGLESISFRYGTDDHDASDDVCYAKGEVQWNEYDPAGLAYIVVSAIYFWFGFTEADIPYVQEIDGRKSLDTEAMIRRVQ